jgi:hypothetical protein
MSQKIEFQAATDDEWPICPECKKELRDIKFKKRGWLTSMTVFWCPYCRCVLSVSNTFNG